MRTSKVRLGAVVTLVAGLALLASCGGGGGGGAADGGDGGTPVLPAASTAGADLVSQTTETLRGSVNPGGLETQYWFEWSTDASLATPNTTPIQTLAASSSAQAVSEDVTGLAKASTLYYRLCARNANGTVAGEVKTCHHYANVVFVTSASGTGNLGGWPEAGGATGIEAGDAICQTLAQGAALGGTFRAWLSNSTVGARDRLAHSAEAYVRVDGTRVADNWTDLTSASGAAYLANPISTDEQGLPVASAVWTDTRGDGTHTASVFWNDNGCRDWHSTDTADWAAFGHSDRTDYTWTETPGSQCDNSLSLYCFEQNLALPQEHFRTGTPGPIGWIWYVSACSDGLYQDPDCVYICSNFYNGTSNCRNIPSTFGGYTVNSCSYNTGLYSMSVVQAGHTFTVRCELH